MVLKVLDGKIVEAVAKALEVKHEPAFVTGITDGFEQGFELSVGMTYTDMDYQWEYDIGAYIGACLAVRGH